MWSTVKGEDQCSVKSYSFCCHIFSVLCHSVETEPLLFLCVFQLAISFLFPYSWQSIICHSCLPSFSPLHLISVSIYLSAYPSAGVARVVEQSSKTGWSSQTASGTIASHQDGRPAL